MSPHDCTQLAQDPPKEKMALVLDKPKTYTLFFWTVCSQSISSIFPCLVQSPRERKVSALYQVGTLLIPSVAIKQSLGSSSLLFMLSTAQGFTLQFLKFVQLFVIHSLRPFWQAAIYLSFLIEKNPILSSLAYYLLLSLAVMTYKQENYSKLKCLGTFS